MNAETKRGVSGMRVIVDPPKVDPGFVLAFPGLSLFSEDETKFVHQVGRHVFYVDARHLTVGAVCGDKVPKVKVIREFFNETARTFKRQRYAVILLFEGIRNDVH